MHPLKKRNTMELTITLTLLTFFFSVLQPACSSPQVQSQHSLQHEGTVKANQELSLPTLPRKLMFTEKVKESDEARDQVSRKQKNSFPSGKQYEKKQDMMVGKKGTRQEWIEEKENDPSQYFTMDYNYVRRRPPIHNKQLPVGP